MKKGRDKKGSGPYPSNPLPFILGNNGAKNLIVHLPLEVSPVIRVNKWFKINKELTPPGHPVKLRLGWCVINERNIYPLTPDILVTR